MLSLTLWNQTIDTRWSTVAQKREQNQFSEDKNGRCTARQWRHREKFWARFEPDRCRHVNYNYIRPTGARGLARRDKLIAGISWKPFRRNGFSLIYAREYSLDGFNIWFSRQVAYGWDVEKTIWKMTDYGATKLKRDKKKVELEHNIENDASFEISTQKNQFPISTFDLFLIYRDVHYITGLEGLGRGQTFKWGWHTSSVKKNTFKIKWFNMIIEFFIK